MRLLTLALLAFLAQEAPAEPKPTRKVPLTLVNRMDTPLRAGAQVRVMLTEFPGGRPADEVHVFHDGKPLASCDSGPAAIWFRLPAEIPARGRDSGFEFRYGGGKIGSRGREVFDFYEDFAKADLDPARWDWDRGVISKRQGNGLNVTDLPGGRNEHAPASLIPRLDSLAAGFEFDVSLLIGTEAAFSFAVKAELDQRIVATEKERKAASRHIRELNAEEIELRERAVKGLIELGAVAVPQLEESAKSADAELRLRSVAAISAIYRENPPPAIACGFNIPGGADKRVDYVTQLGKSRTTQESSLPETGFLSLEIAIARDAEGGTTIYLGEGGNGVSAPVPGKVVRLRLDFWASQAVSTDEFFIRNVRLRQFVQEMPMAKFGAEEAVR